MRAWAAGQARGGRSSMGGIPVEKGEGNFHPRRNQSATAFPKSVSWLDGSRKGKAQGGVRRGELPYAVSASLTRPANPHHHPFPSNLQCHPYHFTI